MDILWANIKQQLNIHKMCDALLAVTDGGKGHMCTAEQYSLFAVETPQEDAQVSILLGEGYPGVFLTEREAHCSLLMILGFTSKEAAEKMYLSPRTVEHYISNVKKKLQLKRKSDIIMTLLNSDFIKNVKQIT